MHELHKSVEFIRSYVPELPDQVINDLKTLDSKPSIVVAGLIKRGKSTLVNQILGVEMAPVGLNPETISSTIFCSTTNLTNSEHQEKSKEDKAGFNFGNYILHNHDEIEQLDRDPFAFKERIKRKNLNEYVQIFANGAFRFPTGFVLIDTPGIDESIHGNSKVGNSVSEAWKCHGATGALLVTSYPPGVSSMDIELYDSLSNHFNNRVIVVMKRTQATVGTYELIEANKVLSKRGITSIVLPDNSINKLSLWESGPLHELEIQMTKLWNSHDIAIDEALGRLEVYFSNAVDECLSSRDFSFSELETLSSICSDQQILWVIRERIRYNIANWYEVKHLNSVLTNAEDLSKCLIALESGSIAAKSKLEFLLTQFHTISTTKLVGFKEVFNSLATRRSSEASNLIRSIRFSENMSSIRMISGCLNELAEEDLELVIRNFEDAIEILLLSVKTESKLNSFGEYLGKFFPSFWSRKYLSIWKNAFVLSTPLNWEINWDRQNLDNGLSHRKFIANLFKLALVENREPSIVAEMKSTIDAIFSEFEQFWNLWEGYLDSGTRSNDDLKQIYQAEKWRLDLISLISRISFVYDVNNLGSADFITHLGQLNKRKFVFWIENGKLIALNSVATQKVSSRLHILFGVGFCVSSFIQFSRFEANIPLSAALFLSGSISVMRAPTKEKHVFKMFGYYQRTFRSSFKSQIYLHFANSLVLVLSPLIIFAILHQFIF